jgi:hypothetical protein
MAKHRVWLSLSILLTIVSASNTGAAQTQVLSPISEETPPAVCRSGSFVSGIRCTGKNCDNIEITCTQLPGAMVGADHRWTRWVSDESTSPAWCGPGPNLIAGMACGGRYCDNVSLYCVPLVNLRTIHCRSTRSVSEESGGSLSFLEGYPSGAKVVGTQLSCSGGYCDNLSFYACQIQWP